MELDRSNNIVLDTYLIIVYVILLSIILITDYSLPLGVAAGVPYVLPILVTIFSEKHSHTYYVSVTGAALTILGYFFSDKAGIFWMVIVNRSLALFVIFITGLFVINRKMSESKIKALNNKLQQQATTDSLTNIGNRLLFSDIINKEIENAIRYNRFFSLIYFDIDHFKNINDTHGHDVGDKVLIKLTQIISNNIRIADSFFRIGGEEFAIILTETDIEAAKNIAEKLREKISNINEGVMASITISIGVTSMDKTDNTENLMKRADIAMYKSKNNGRNQVNVLCEQRASG